MKSEVLHFHPFMKYLITVPNIQSWKENMIFNHRCFLFIILLSLLPSYCLADDDYYDEIKAVQISTESAQMEMKAIRECPLLVSKNLPYDYRKRFNSTLPVNLKFSMYRFAGIDDVQQILSFVGMLTMFYSFYNCGFENGSNISFTLSGGNQWFPRLYHDTAFQYVDVPKE